MHLIDSRIQSIDCYRLFSSSKLHTLVHLLLPHEVDNVAELLLEAIGSNFSLLHLQYLHQVPLIKMIVATEIVLYLQNLHRVVLLLFNGHLTLLPVILYHDHLKQKLVTLRKQVSLVQMRTGMINR